MVTPSLVINGEPKDFSKTTLRPFGPNVTLTVSANLSTPRNIALRASSENLISFAIFFHLKKYFLFNYCNNVFY